MLTALEIFTNPNDLEILIGQEKGGGKYAFAITRGPGHDFKMMISSQPFTEKLEDAIEVIKVILESIREAIARDFENIKSVPSQYLNPDGQAIDQSKILNNELIVHILDELRQHQVASTHKMLATAG